jgi:hypothetical protein
VHKWINYDNPIRSIEITDRDGDRVTLIAADVLPPRLLAETRNGSDSVAVCLVDADRRALIVALGGAVPA